MRAVRVARTILRDAFPLVVDRLTAAGSLVAIALSVAGVVWGRAPDDPDPPRLITTLSPVHPGLRAIIERVA